MIEMNGLIYKIFFSVIWALTTFVFLRVAPQQAGSHPLLFIGIFFLGLLAIIFSKPGANGSGRKVAGKIFGWVIVIFIFLLLINYLDAGEEKFQSGPDLYGQTDAHPLNESKITIGDVGEDQQVDSVLNESEFWMSLSPEERKNIKIRIEDEGNTAYFLGGKDSKLNGVQGTWYYIDAGQREATFNINIYLYIARGGAASYAPVHVEMEFLDMAGGDEDPLHHNVYWVKDFSEDKGICFGLGDRHMQASDAFNDMSTISWDDLDISTKGRFYQRNIFIFVPYNTTVTISRLDIK